jgi:outer membrane murein-binding lipoprotein Lpp
MMDEQVTRFTVLLEDMDRKLGAVAEAVASQGERLTGLEHKLDRRIDELDVKFMGIAIEIRTKVNELGTKVDKLETKVDKLETKVDKLEVFATDAGPRLERLEVFATDAGPRLERIEDHLALNQPLPRNEPTRTTPSEQHRRKPAKRT